jgi:catechol 2,3-dioxygenase-like lactoylglutathione lyase family enzyme
VRRFDHVGITVADLDRATACFVGLGLEVEGRIFVEGEFVDTIIGIPGSRSEIVMLRPPGGGAGPELSSFIRPGHEPGSPAAMSTELGLRNVAFEVDELQAAVDRPAAAAPAWLAAWVNTSTSGACPTCADRRESSCPWPSGSADAAVGEPGRLLVRVQPRVGPDSIQVGAADVRNAGPLAAHDRHAGAVQACLVPDRFPAGRIRR